MREAQYVADAPVESFHHAIGLWAAGWYQAVLYTFCRAELVEQVVARGLALSGRHKAVCKLLVVVSKGLGNVEGRFLDQPLEKPPGVAGALAGENFKILVVS